MSPRSKTIIYQLSVRQDAITDESDISRQGI
jgi:hypothetical protein